MLNRLKRIAFASCHKPYFSLAAADEQMVKEWNKK